MNKPNWKYAPEWAKYLAMNIGGRWCWFEYKPELHEEYMTWYTTGKIHGTSIFSDIELSPQNTLEERPE